MVLQPAGYERLGNEIVHGTFEETLHLAGMEVDCDNVVDAGYIEEVGDHASSDSSTVGLLLGLARVGEIRHDGCCNVTSAPLCNILYHDLVPVIDLAEPDLQADIMMRSSMTLSLILLLPL